MFPRSKEGITFFNLGQRRRRNRSGTLDESQRILHLLRGRHSTVHPALDPLAVDTDQFAAGQADDRVSTPFFTALHRFEQKAVGPFDELEIDAERRIEVGQHLANDRDAVVALLQQGIEFVRGHDLTPQQFRTLDHETGRSAAPSRGHHKSPDCLEFSHT